MTVNGIKRFLKSNGITIDQSDTKKENLILPNVSIVYLRNNGNHFIHPTNKLTFDFTNELLLIKEYTADGNQITNLPFDFAIDFFAIEGFAAR